jgi:hypothetical protein
MMARDYIGSVRPGGVLTALPDAAHDGATSMKNAIALPALRRTLALLAALAGLLNLAGLPAGTLEGTWKLVEQRRGAQTLNTAPESPVRLEFAVSGGKLQGRIWAGDDRDTSQPWPAAMADRGPVRIEVKELLIDPRTQRARASYVVKPAGTGGETLDVVETYALADDGRSLTGTLTVSAGEAGKRGSYTLYRRFEREK